MRFWTSSINILICAIIGSVLGYFFKDAAIYFKPLGDIFMQLIRMLIIPIIIFSIINSTSYLSETQKAGKIGSYSIIYIFVTSCVASALGIIFALFFKPGAGLSQIPSSLMNGQEVYKNTLSSQKIDFVSFFMNIIPENPIKAMVEGNILQTIVFAIILGIAISYIQNNNKEILQKSINVLNDAFMWIMGKIMYIAPIAVFGLMFYAVGVLGFDIIKLTLKLLFVYVVAIVIFIYVIIGFIVHFLSKTSYFTFFKGMIPLKLISFTTASSLVSLPTNIKSCLKLGYNKDIVNFVLPIGSTVNMTGNAMFYSMATIFFAQMFGIHLELSDYFIIIFTSVVGAIGTAGVPGPTLLIVAVLVSVHIPLTGLPLLFAVDRIFDMIRTSANVVGDASCVAVLDKLIDKKSIFEVIKKSVRKSK